MDAADDPDDAQLCWTGARRPCAPAASSKVLFDVFAPQDSCDDDAACMMAVPDTATRFDLAAGDLVVHDKLQRDDPALSEDPTSIPHDLDDEPPVKKELDDASTPGPHLLPSDQPVSWHDVGDDDVDFGNFRFLRGAGASATPGAFGDTGELEPCKGHAASNSQEHETQCGNSQHDYADDASPLAFDGSDAVPDDSDTLGYDYSRLGPQSDIPTSFQEFARSMLPDVYPSSDHSEPSHDGDSCEEQLSPDGEGHEEAMQGFGGSLTSRTQCGPLPLEFDHGFFPVLALDAQDNLCTQDAPCTGPSLNSTQAQHTPLATEAQCGPLPQPPTLTPFKDPRSLNLCMHDALCTGRLLDTTQAQYAPLATEAQCGPLPQHRPVLDFEGFSIFDLDEAGNLSTQPQPLDDGSSLGSLQPSLDGFTAARAATAQLLEASMSGDWNARSQALQAYEAATHVLHMQLEQFEVESKDILSLPTRAHVPILADDRPQRVISLADALGVHGEGCAPIPDEEIPSTFSKDQKKKKKRRHGRRRL